MTTITVTPPPPINIVIPPPPPVVVNTSRNNTVIQRQRPTNPPPPPPVSNPFVATRQLPRTPVRNNTITDTRSNIAQLNNNLQFRSVNRNHINGLNFLRR